ncbi:MAG: PIN domain-containing protein [Nitrososphaerota archaeon]|jgi:predicted nucleic acid-binding protein|nr:PIN domain-containing protein [Nitrososphaerota archaeon]MDG6961878.1 PIN domain-containing protein [Nitrososphaerota archaeon]MDG6993158.1 PIN domain-containing protein [Nitrososphaerota archaeon]MDG7003288.1 PIN domain-containing protein [Nitrososphaerota archaeon]
MLLESDILVAYLKEDDWLKPTAEKVIAAVEGGRLGEVSCSAATLHEMYYVFSEHAPIQTILADFARVTTIKNLKFVDPSAETYLSALHLARTYGITSVFDALYAATALSPMVPDHTILSTDGVFEKVPGLKRQPPEGLRLQ